VKLLLSTHFCINELKIQILHFNAFSDTAEEKNRPKTLVPLVSRSKFAKIGKLVDNHLSIVSQFLLYLMHIARSVFIRF